MSWIPVVRIEELKPGSVRSVELGDERILVCPISADQVYAVENCCSHDGGVLGEGRIDGTVVECPRHGGRFDVTDGRAVRMPAVASIATFATRLTESGWLEIDIEDD